MSEVLPTRPFRVPLLYRAAKAVLGRPLRWLYTIDVDGLDHLPAEGPAVVAANHASFMDSIFLVLSCPRPITFIAKAEYFDHRMTRWIFRGTGQIPLRRGSPTSARGAMAAACGVLAEGGVVGMYPEGTRSRDGRLQRGQLGPARLSAASGAPIVPVGLVGTAEVQRPTERRPHLFRPVGVRFGAGRRTAVSGGAASRACLRHTTDELMTDIAVLSGQKPFAPDAVLEAARR